MTLDLPRKGLLKQELISYEIEDKTNMVTKKTHTRTYASDGIDYIDHSTSEPLFPAAKNEENEFG